MNRFILDLASFIKEKGEVTWGELKKEFDCNSNTLSFYLGQIMSSGFVKKSNVDTIPVSEPIFTYIPLQTSTEKETEH